MDSSHTVAANTTRMYLTFHPYKKNILNHKGNNQPNYSLDVGIKRLLEVTAAQLVLLRKDNDREEIYDLSEKG
ncbi:hypothetical protein Tco_0863831 [Tanacetum coccineum]